MPAPSSAEGRDFREPFLAELLMRIGEPSGARPTVRCWSETALSQALGLEPNGVLRLSLLHYNTREEVAFTLAVLRDVLAAL